MHTFNGHMLVIACGSGVKDTRQTSLGSRTVIVAECLGVGGAQVVDSPRIRVLPSCLVLEQGQEQVLSEYGIRVQECRPSGEDHVDSVHVLMTLMSVQE